MGLWYSKDSYIALIAFADADHACRQDTRRSTSRSIHQRNIRALPYLVQKLNTLPYQDV
ncbi:hypothetical protein Tco_0350226, partial [Tanacetum coccineum]